MEGRGPRRRPPSRGSVLFGVGTRPDVVPTSGDSLARPGRWSSAWLDLLAILLAVGPSRCRAGCRALGSRSDAAAETGGSARASRGDRRRRHGRITPFLRTQVDGLSSDAWMGVTTQLIVDSPWGHLWLARQVALVVAAAAFWWWVARATRGRAAPCVALAALIAVAGIEAWAGHASALPSGSVVTAAAAMIHVLAAGVWAGGLIVLAIALVPMMRVQRRSRRATLTRVWRAYSPMAATAAVLLVASGLLETGRHVPTATSLTSTVYGGGLITKIVLVCLALAIAGGNAIAVHPHLRAVVGRVLHLPVGWSSRPRRFATLVLCEVLVLVAAMGTAALLTSVPTARETAAASEPTTPQSATVDGIFVTFENIGSGTDRSRMVVRARSTVRPEPAPIIGASVRWTSPSGVGTDLTLTAVEPGHFESEAPRPRPGSWTAEVSIQRRGHPESVTAIAWTVGTTPPAPRVATGRHNRRGPDPADPPDRRCRRCGPASPPTDGPRSVGRSGTSGGTPGRTPAGTGGCRLGQHAR